jgi:hypothetical protein
MFKFTNVHIQKIFNIENIQIQKMFKFFKKQNKKKCSISINFQF